MSTTALMGWLGNWKLPSIVNMTFIYSECNKQVLFFGVNPTYVETDKTRLDGSGNSDCRVKNFLPLDLSEC